MKARIKWIEERTLIGESGSGHKIVLGTAFDWTLLNLGGAWERNSENTERV